MLRERTNERTARRSTHAKRRNAARRNTTPPSVDASQITNKPTTHVSDILDGVPELATIALAPSVEVAVRRHSTSAELSAGDVHCSVTLTEEGNPRGRVHPAYPEFERACLPACNLPVKQGELLESFAAVVAAQGLWCALGFVDFRGLSCLCLSLKFGGEARMPPAYLRCCARARPPSTILLTLPSILEQVSEGPLAGRTTARRACLARLASPGHLAKRADT